VLSARSVRAQSGRDEELKKSRARRLAAAASHDWSAGLSALPPGRAGRTDNTGPGGTNLRYDASSGEVQAHVRQSCFVHVLQGG